MCVDVYYWDYQKDSDGNLLKDAVHLYIPFKTLSEADELSEIVYGKSIEEIKQEFGSYLTQPGLDEKIDSAEKVAELNDKGKEQTQLRSYIYKGEF